MQMLDIHSAMFSRNIKRIIYEIRVNCVFWLKDKKY
jgi:hypothetical protein